MSRYIDADKLKQDLDAWAINLHKPTNLVRNDTFVIIDEQPTADVEPVRHGHWIRESVGSDNSSEGYFKISMAECSECGTCVIGKPNYCPNCGARMRMTKEQYESHVGDIYEDGDNNE